MKMTSKECAAMTESIVKTGQIPEFMRKHVPLKPSLKPLLDRLMIYEVAYASCTSNDANEKRFIRKAQRVACETFVSMYYKRKYKAEFEMDGYEYFKAVCNCNPEYRIPLTVHKYVENATDKKEGRV